ncbi:hypothetical protein [Novosphingobium panipatense]|uniref:Uncharacterized protein n=1 Tax=Novosphingobium panipatense TaxID=428991 RepID=A0ABY1Q5D9_9SPHN|nr:hypothetical protein [Novosphingobium panipatense]SMP58408.1 hypothetical protein SAMN06296065_102466 [Novosphingobium panipatense]
MATYGPEYEGKTAISKDGKRRIVIRNGEAVVDTSYTPPASSGGPAKTSADDRKALIAAQSRAAAERDAMRSYRSAGHAIKKISGPTKAAWLDAITPKPDGGILDKIGGILGTPFRALEDDETLGAMDELSTVGASAALKNSANVKGAASDKDMALIRLAGLGPYKTQGENTRIVKDAMYQSGLEQLRAKLTAQWIARNGSLSNPNAKGQTFESYLTLGEGMYADRMSGRTKPRTKSLPKPPPSAKGAKPVTIDLEGNIVE